MKRTLIFILAASFCALAQESGNVIYRASGQASGAGPVTAVAFGAMAGSGGVVTGAPYSATITNESVQTLADGTHITSSSSGTTARDSQGRTRQDAPLPALGNLSATDAPHLVFLQDPVAGASYTLNLTDKTAWKGPVPPPGGGGSGRMMISTNTVVVQSADGAPLPPPPPDAPAASTMFLQKRLAESDGDVATENLGSQTMEGVQVTGVRTTRTIAVGKIGNDRPITITTEVWTSPDLKTIVLSKRNDPRMGEQTFKLTNIQRSEPDPSLFTVPSDFTISEGGPRTVMYRSKP
ncbi:MAG: hypothetical protein WBS19_13385 [Candidatus Korobacteraceae bacterium]